jgi:3-hydroxybutyryl-CoA dehydrogenase
MSKSGFKSVGIIGIGTMGNGIAQVAAQSGFTTKVVDIHQASLDKGMATIESNLGRMVASYEKSGGERGITAEQKDAAWARLSGSTQLSDLLDCDIIIEAAVEREDIKRELFTALNDKQFKGVLATNTSSISITRLAASVSFPERFMGMHFMNPVPLQQGVEIIRGLLTDDATYNKVVALCQDMGKVEIPAEDKAGFGINRMWVPFVNEAIRVVEEGVMAPDEADKCTLCLGHKMGPIITADYVGLDVILFICNVLEEEFGSAYKASPLLKRLVEAGQLGVKSGTGFYIWEGGKAVSVNPAVARYRIG